MKLESALSDRILEVVTRTPSCRVEDLVYHFPDLTWSQVFREVASLSRKGHLRLMLNGRGIIVRNVDRGRAVLWSTDRAFSRTAMVRVIDIR